MATAGLNILQVAGSYGSRHRVGAQMNTRQKMRPQEATMGTQIRQATSPRTSVYRRAALVTIDTIRRGDVLIYGFGRDATKHLVEKVEHSEDGVVTLFLTDSGFRQAMPSVKVFAACRTNARR